MYGTLPERHWLVPKGGRAPEGSTLPAFQKRTEVTGGRCPGLEGERGVGVGVYAHSWPLETVLRTTQDLLPRWTIPQARGKCESPRANFWATHLVFSIGVV